MRPPLAKRPSHLRGAALVEFALCASLLILLLFGTVDIGLLLSDQAALNEAAAQAARALSLGASPTVAVSRAVAATDLPLTADNFLFDRSAPDSQGNPTSWSALGADTTGNDAVPGEFVRVTASYSHPLITSILFAGKYHTLSASLTLNREVSP